MLGDLFRLTFTYECHKKSTVVKQLTSFIFYVRLTAENNYKRVKISKSGI